MLGLAGQEWGQPVLENGGANVSTEQAPPLYRLTVGLDLLWEQIKGRRSPKKIKRCAMCNDTGIQLASHRKRPPGSDDASSEVELCPYCPARAILGGRYEIVRQLGAGNFSQVFLVRDLFHMPVVRVIKLLKPEFTPLAHAEAYWLERLARLDGEGRLGVQKYHGRVQLGDQSGLVLEYLQSPPSWSGSTFQRVSDSLQRLQRMIVDVSLLLHALHAPPFSAIHADVKLDNLMWSEEDSRFRLIDFGNCTPLDKLEEYRQSYEIQSLLYRAPEVLVGLEISSKIDIWSLGVVVLQTLHPSGQPPFLATSRDGLLQQIAELTGPFPDTFAAGKFYTPAVPLAGTFEQTTGFWRRWRQSNIARFLGLRNVHLADLLAGMLECDPEARLGLTQILRHPFVAPLVPFPLQEPASIKSFLCKGDSLN